MGTATDSRRWARATPGDDSADRGVGLMALSAIEACGTPPAAEALVSRDAVDEGALALAPATRSRAATFKVGVVSAAATGTVAASAASMPAATASAPTAIGLGAEGVDGADEPLPNGHMLTIFTAASCVRP